MTRKHFKMIASAIRESKIKNASEETEWQRKVIAVSIGTALKRENPKFDYATFITACGFEE